VKERGRARLGGKVNAGLLAVPEIALVSVENAAAHALGNLH
jgi:hypothetical protein